MKLYTCDDLEERLYDTLDGELSPEQEAAVRQHLAVCEPCQEQLEHEKQFLAAVRETCRGIQAPEGLLEKIRQSIERC